MKTPYAILGGGVAGLTAANRLADRGAHAVLIEAGSFPAHRVCGEFLSPEALPQLRAWDLEPEIQIRRARLVQGTRELGFDLPSPAAACSRWQLDLHLAERAAKQGIELRTGTRVTGIQRMETGGYRIDLDQGDSLQAGTLLIGTGRIPGLSRQPGPPPMKYLGFKMHFRGLELEDTLWMFAFPGAYLGLCHVEADCVNLTGLARLEEAPLSPEDLLARFRYGSPILDQLLQPAEPLLEDWLSVQVPEFGPRCIPDWPEACFIGDAAGSIVPATGNGLGMGVTGGVLAADFALDGEIESYRRVWRQRYRSRFRWGRLLHEALLHPASSRLLMQLGQRSSSLPNLLFRKTREAA